MPTLQGEIELILDFENDKIKVRDNTDYTGYLLGSRRIDSIVFDGTTIYDNTSGNNQDFPIPYGGIGDVSIADIDIPKTSTGEYKIGAYTVTFKAFEENDPIDWLDAVQYGFTGYTTPTLDITHVVNCGSNTEDPELTSTDSTDYAQGDPAWTVSLTRVHTLSFPDDPDTGSPIKADITNALQDLSTNEFYTGEQVTTLSVDIVYTVTSGVEYQDSISGTKEVIVSCPINLCQIHDILEAINEKYLLIKGSNTNREAIVLKKWERAVGLAIQIRESSFCGDSDSINRDIEELYKIFYSIECSENVTVPTTLVIAPFATDQNTITIAYASDDSGSNFSFTPLVSTSHFAVYAHNQTYTPVVSDYAGLWLPIAGSLVWGDIAGTLSDQSDLQDELQISYNTASTGIIYGGEISINSLDGSTFDVAAGSGYIVDDTVNPATIKVVTWTKFSGVTLTNLATSFATDIAINSAGDIVQQDSYTNQELRSLIFLGGLDHSNQTEINNVFEIQIPSNAVGSSLYELSKAVGDINISGNVFNANGANLKLNKTAGTAFKYGSNNTNNKNNPHTTTQPLQSPVTFNYVFDDGSFNGSFLGDTTDINPNIYDDGSGTLATVGTNKFTVQRLLLFANSGSVFVQVGTQVFNKMSEAVSGLSTVNFPNLSGITTAIVRGFLIVQEGATNLQDATQAKFITADRFGAIGSASAGGGTVDWGNILGTLSDQTDLQNALNLKLDKALGVELRTSKANFQFQQIGDSWHDADRTGFFEGNLNDPPPFDDTRGAYVIMQKLGTGGNFYNLIASSLDGTQMAFKGMDGAGNWTGWKLILDESDKILSISDLDLSDSTFWNPATKTLDLSTKAGIGIINFNSTYSAVSIADISTANPAVLKFSDVASANLFQNDQLVNFSGIEGGSPFADLNSGDYMIKNIDYVNFTFELYESDGVTAVDTRKVTLAEITNVTTSAEAVFTVADASSLSNGMLIELDSVGGMPSLSGITYEITQLAGLDFKLLVYGSDGIFVSTDGLTYTSGGTVISAEYEQNGTIAFKDGVIETTVNKIIGLDNGTQVKYLASDNNEIDFNATNKSLASSGDIVRDLSSISVLDKDGLVELLTYGGINLMMHRKTFA